MEKKRRRKLFNRFSNEIRCELRPKLNVHCVVIEKLEKNNRYPKMKKKRDYLQSQLKFDVSIVPWDSDRNEKEIQNSNIDNNKNEFSLDGPIF